jgi:hypothetical protein
MHGRERGPSGSTLAVRLTCQQSTVVTLYEISLTLLATVDVWFSRHPTGYVDSDCSGSVQTSPRGACVR